MNAGAEAAVARGLAVFDLDGTITRHDTFLPYLRGWIRRHPGRGRAWPVIVALARYVAAAGDRGRLKSDLIRAWMIGASRSEVESWTSDYADSLDAAAFCPGALAAIACHRAAGDRMVLLSASVDLYVPAIARLLGFDEVICTGVAWNGDRLEGTLTTPNRRAEEKRRCLDTLRSRHPGSQITAYGNARSDLAHLAAADRAVLVNARPGIQRAARRLGIGAQDWCNKAPP
ncbi:MAG: HAD family hydrolase [Steroidobacteraceae bacterium]